MSLRFLLDTNVISEPLRPVPSRNVVRRLRRHEGEIAIASVVWHELRFGASRLLAGGRRAAIDSYLSAVVAESVPILPYDGAAADWHAIERARLAASGRTPPFADGQIAAIARVHELTLVTANEKDFSIFSGLRIVSWA